LVASPYTMGVQDESDKEDGHVSDGSEPETPQSPLAASPERSQVHGQSPPTLRQSLRERGGRPTPEEEEEGAWLEDRPMVSGDRPQGATEQEATLNLLNALLGNSMLALPWAFAQVGMVPGTCFLIAGTLINRYTLHLLLKNAEVGSKGGYPRIGRNAFGWLGEAVVLSLYVIIASLALCAYAVGLADIIQQLAPSFGIGELSRPLAGLLAVAACGPGMLAPSLKKVARLSAVNLVAAVTFCVVLLSFAVQPRDASVLPPEHAPQWARWENTLKAWPLFSYVFAVQPSGMMVLSKIEGSANLAGVNMIDDDEVEELEASRDRVSAQAHVVALLVGILFGIASYLRFGGLVRGNVLNTCNDFRAQLWFGSLTVLRLCSCIMLVSSAAYVMFAVRFSVLESLRVTGLLVGTDEAPATFRRRITYCMFCLMSLVGAFCDDISQVYGIIGSFGTPLFAFILPGMFALKLVAASGRRRRMIGPLMSAVFGVLQLLLSVVQLFST